MIVLSSTRFLDSEIPLLLGSLRTFLVIRSEQVTYTPYSTMASYATDWHRKKSFGFQDEGLVTALVSPLEKVSDRRALHCAGRPARWECIRSARELDCVQHDGALVPLFIKLQRPWA